MSITPWPANLDRDPSLLEAGRDGSGLEKLVEQGAVLVRGVYPPRLMADLRARIEAVIRRSLRDGRHEPTHPNFPEGRTILGDLPGMGELRDLDYLVFDPLIVSYARRILGPDLFYFGDSCIRMGFGGRGFHKDFLEHTDSTILMIRFALYLQDHVRGSGGLKIRLRSHRKESRHLGPMMNVPTRLGDLVIFDLRLSHTGNNVRLKGLNRLCLHPRLESLVPQGARAPVEMSRICLLWSFAVPGPLLDHYVDWIVSLGPDHWKLCGWSAELAELARRRGVTLRKSTPDQGVLLAGAGARAAAGS